MEYNPSLAILPAEPHHIWKGKIEEFNCTFSLSLIDYPEDNQSILHVVVSYDIDFAPCVDSFEYIYMTPELESLMQSGEIIAHVKETYLYSELKLKDSLHVRLN